MIFCGDEMTSPLLVRRAGRVPDMEKEVCPQAPRLPTHAYLRPIPASCSSPFSQGHCIPEGLCQGLLILCTFSGAPVNLV